MECKKCENCKNKYSFLCSQREMETSERTPCKNFKEYPKGLTPKELISLLETMPQDKQIVVDTEGLFAVTGCEYEEDYIYVTTDLISW